LPSQVLAKAHRDSHWYSSPHLLEVEARHTETVREDFGEAEAMLATGS
jgi:hypothetical protein